MKRIILLLGLLCLTTSIFAQTDADVVAEYTLEPSVVIGRAVDTSESPIIVTAGDGEFTVTFKHAGNGTPNIIFKVTVANKAGVVIGNYGDFTNKGTISDLSRGTYYFTVITDAGVEYINKVFVR